jgi:hypothetical protein
MTDERHSVRLLDGTRCTSGPNGWTWTNHDGAEVPVLEGSVVAMALRHTRDKANIENLYAQGNEPPTQWRKTFFDSLEAAFDDVRPHEAVARLGTFARWIVVSEDDFERSAEHCGWIRESQPEPLMFSEVLARAAAAMFDMGFGRLVMSAEPREGVA